MGMGQAAVESEAETLHRAPQIQPWIPGRGAGGGALGGRREGRDPEKIFKPLGWCYGAVSSGCSHDVLCGLGHVTRGLCAKLPIPRKTVTHTQA